MNPTPPPNQGQPGQPAPRPPASPQPRTPEPSKIQHSRPGIGLGAAGAPPATPVPPAPPPANPSAPPTPAALDPFSGDTPGVSAAGAAKITMFGRERQHDQGTWNRTPNTTGTGAIHVKTFHCKLVEDALQYMDVAINEWLDAHPQYEVKFVTSNIGTMTGKLKEPALICQVWV